MFDVTFNIMGLDVQAPDEEALAAGAPPVLSYVLVAGSQLPLAGPDGQPIVIPAAHLNFKLPKDPSMEFGSLVTELAEKLPELKESDLVIASNLSDADNLANQMQGMQGRPRR